MRLGAWAVAANPASVFSSESGVMYSPLLYLDMSPRSPLWKAVWNTEACRAPRASRPRPSSPTPCTAFQACETTPPVKSIP